MLRGTSAGRGTTPIPVTAELSLLNLPPVGFNYYSLLSDIYYNLAGGATSRPLNLQYIANTGSKLVRVAFSGFSASDYTTFIHTNGTIPFVVNDSNLLASFKTACDTVMDALAQYGLKGMLCIAFSQGAIPTAFSETQVTAFSSTTSKTAVYVQSFAQWLVNRYQNHAAFGLLAIGNEYVTDSTGTTNATPTLMGLWFKAVADAAKKIKANTIVTADITAPVVALARNRETIEQSITRYRQLFVGLDVYCLHVYGDDYAFTGHMASENGATPNIYYDTLGYEGVEAMMQAYSDMALADGKPLIIGEYGVSTTNEADDPGGANAAFVSDKKKWRFSRAVVPYASVSLLWNVQLTSIAAVSGGQSIWCIDPQSTSSRATQFGAIATAFNNGVTAKRNIGAALASRRNVIRPSVAMWSQNRVAGTGIKFMTTTAHSSTTGYSVAFWVNLQATLNNGEVISDFRSGTTAGFVFLASLVSNSQTFYSDGRSVGGSTGNSSGALPDLNIGEMNHVCIQMKQINVNGTTVYTTELWVNGVYWLTVTANAVPTSIPIATVVSVLGNSNGVPLKIQDYAMFPSITPQEIWDHMAGVVNPRAMLHIRGYEDGTIVDLSKNAVALTVTSIPISVER